MKKKLVIMLICVISVLMFFTACNNGNDNGLDTNEIIVGDNLVSGFESYNEMVLFTYSTAIGKVEANKDRAFVKEGSGSMKLTVADPVIAAGQLKKTYFYAPLLNYDGKDFRNLSQTDVVKADIYNASNSDALLNIYFVAIESVEIQSNAVEYSLPANSWLDFSYTLNKAELLSTVGITDVKYVAFEITGTDAVIYFDNLRFTVTDEKYQSFDPIDADEGSAINFLEYFNVSESEVKSYSFARFNGSAIEIENMAAWQAYFSGIIEVKVERASGEKLTACAVINILNKYGTIDNFEQNSLDSYSLTSASVVKKALEEENGNTSLRATVISSTDANAGVNIIFAQNNIDTIKKFDYITFDIKARYENWTDAATAPNYKLEALNARALTTLYDAETNQLFSSNLKAADNTWTTVKALKSQYVNLFTGSNGSRLIALVRQTTTEFGELHVYIDNLIGGYNPIELTSTQSVNLLTATGLNINQFTNAVFVSGEAQTPITNPVSFNPPGSGKVKFTAKVSGYAATEIELSLNVS